ncbi:histidinol-phosphatase (PHP family) [Streptomyces sp. V3I8]|uniref:PHP domain-containing protein n=1 Tax=Streptomyces sp. V3I8 TaxID=3042279 RepID=UPI00277F36DD|nr:PHP domain-containing protein [Streptomyces sp. V3I8]MDQ1041583.1 histidinol-phosphatase (PHP family) [Streptomyces sp. V3I8]
MLPADNHIHTQWSWDALAGSMEATCQQALSLGLRSLAFTEHTDFTTWTIPATAVATMPDAFQAMVGADGLFRTPPFDVEGYLGSIARCRALFPSLHIVTGVELGEPHWYAKAVGDLLAAADFGRVVGSLHSLESGGRLLAVDRLFGLRPPADIVRDYLREVTRMVRTSDAFEILGHIDYPLRSWPADAGPCRISMFEDEFRAALRALAAGGRVLEVNTSRMPYGAIIRWWYECGGGALSFGSDAHQPGEVARNFREAALLAESEGFRPGHMDHDFWTR